MKKALVIFTAAAIFLSSMSNAVIFVGFKLNQMEIERLYCVNKAKPQMHCHGKCHLAKQLTETNQKSELPSPLTSMQESSKLQLFHQPLGLLLCKSSEGELTSFWGVPQTPNSRLFGNSTFQPPDIQPSTC